MGKMQREKGARGERQAAKAMTETLGVLVERTRQFKGSPHSADLEGVNGLHLEVKRTERFSLYPSMEQAESQAGEDCPVVLHRRNSKRWVVVMYLHDFLDVTASVYETRKIWEGDA